jgi:hypothetical protein
MKKLILSPSTTVEKRHERATETMRRESVLAADAGG